MAKTRIVKPTVISVGNMNFLIEKNDDGLGFKVVNSLGNECVFPTRNSAVNYVRSIPV